jgi:hypothetical protein
MAREPISAFLEEGGGRVEKEYSSLPVVRATLTKAQLSSWFLNGPLVTSMEVHDASRGEGELLGHAGAASMNMSSLSGGLCSGTPCSGGGLLVGYWEKDHYFLFASYPTSGVARNNYYLNDNIYYLNQPVSCVTDADCSGDPAAYDGRYCAVQPLGNKICVQEHLTWVVGSVGRRGSYNYGTTYPLPQGSNPGDYIPNVPAGTTFPASGAWLTDMKIGNDNDLDGLDYLVGAAGGVPPTHYVNRSVTNIDEHANWVGRAHGTFLVAGAGNDASAPVANSVLRNGLVVGSYDYATYNSQSTHRRSYFSSHINDAVVDATLERPHLLGPGNHSGSSSGLHLPWAPTSVGTYRMQHREGQGIVCNPCPQIAGTSFAAPQVLAMALLSHEYEGLFSAMSYPTALKSVLLASTRDANADGAIGKSTTWAQATDAVDGAGEIDANRVKQVLDNNQYVHRDLADADFVSCGTGCRQVQVATVSAAAGQPVRAALAWQACMTSAAGNVTMNNDLDLAVQGSTYLFHQCYGYTHSATVTSEVEMVERSCPSALTYKIFVRLKNGASLQSCGATSTERVGVAWTLGTASGGGSGI